MKKGEKILEVKNAKSQRENCRWAKILSWADRERERCPGLLVPKDGFFGSVCSKRIDFRAILRNTLGTVVDSGLSRGRPYKFCGGRRGPGVILERFLPNCGPSARPPGAGMQQPRAGAAARDAGAAGHATPSGTPAASGCAAFAGGVVRPPATLSDRAVIPHRRGGRQAAGGLQHACARSGLCARAHARGPPPGTGVGEAHTRLADDPLGPARGRQTRCVLPTTLRHSRSCCRNSNVRTMPFFSWVQVPDGAV